MADSRAETKRQILTLLDSLDLVPDIRDSDESSPIEGEAKAVLSVALEGSDMINSTSKPRLCKRGENSYQIKLGSKGLGSFRSLEEAEARLAVLTAELPKVRKEMLPNLPKVAGQTLTSLAIKAFAEMEQSGYETTDDYRSSFSRYVATHAISRIPIQLLKKGDCQQWLNWLERQTFRDRPLGSQTVKNVRNSLARVTKYAIKEGLLIEDPSDRLIYRTRRKERNVNSLTMEETFRLMTHPDIPEKDRRLYQFAVWSDMRSGEIRSLLWTDVDWTKGTIRIGSSGFRKDGSRKTRTKNGKKREIPILYWAREALLGQQASNPEGCPWVFPNSQGGANLWPLSDAQYRRHLQTIGAVGLDPGKSITFHSLRRTGSTALEEGWLGEAWTLSETSSMLGHSSLAQTEAYSDAKSKLAINRAKLAA